MIFLHIVCILVALIALRSAWRYRPTRLPLALYLLSYTCTCAVGAAIIGLSTNYDWLEATNSGLNLGMIGTSVNTATYWLLVYSPFIVVPVSLSLSTLLFRHKGVSAPLQRFARHDVNIVAFSIVGVALLIYCGIALYTNGFIGSGMLERIVSVTQRYDDVMKLRVDMMTSLHSLFYCVLYMTLPALSHIALHQALAKHSRRWLAITIALIAIITALSLLTMQKTIVIVYWLSLLLGLAIKGKVRVVMVSLVGLVFVIAAVTRLELILDENWTLSNTVSLLVFRLATSLPFYAAVYPTFQSYHGLDLGQDIIRMGRMPDDNLVVFDYMYPGITWIRGAAAAPAHVRAYAQGGMITVLFTLVIIGWLIVLLGRLDRIRGSPLGYAVFIQGCVCMYYLTQTSLREALLSSYGLFWAFLGIGVIWLTAAKRVRFPRSKVRVSGRRLSVARARS